MGRCLLFHWTMGMGFYWWSISRQVHSPLNLRWGTLHPSIVRVFLWATRHEQHVPCEACFSYVQLHGLLLFRSWNVHACVCTRVCVSCPSSAWAVHWRTHGVILPGVTVILLSLLNLNFANNPLDLSEARPCLLRWPLEWQQKLKHCSWCSPQKPSEKD